MVTRLTFYPPLSVVYRLILRASAKKVRTISLGLHRSLLVSNKDLCLPHYGGKLKIEVTLLSSK